MKLELILFSVLVTVNNVIGLSPVILIPGDGGSQLEAKLNKTNVVHYICAKTSADYFNIWLNLELLVPFVIDCWVDNTRLEYDNVTRTTRAPAGVSIRVPGWGSTEPVEWLDPSHDKTGAYFSTIADALVKMGYVRNVSIKGAPYDFRRAPNENGEFFVKLKALVEETFEANNKTQVSLLTHSMGGNMALHFLRLQTDTWKKKYIRRFISLSAPWGGAIKALKVFAIGDDLGSRLLPGSRLRAEQVSCPSLAWLLPARGLYRGEVLVQTDRYNYTIDDLQKFFMDIDLPQAWEMWLDTRGLAWGGIGGGGTAGGGTEGGGPGVELHCLWGGGLPTVRRLQYKAGTWLDGTPTLIPGDGDGTVGAASLGLCAAWPQARGRPLPGADHLAILHDPRALAYLAAELRRP